MSVPSLSSSSDCKSLIRDSMCSISSMLFSSISVWVEESSFDTLGLDDDELSCRYNWFTSHFLWISGIDNKLKYGCDFENFKQKLFSFSLEQQWGEEKEVEYVCFYYLIYCCNLKGCKCRCLIFTHTAAHDTKKLVYETVESNFITLVSWNGFLWRV